ncbi:MAG: histidine kinase [Kineosporiaceae bacterium]
MPRTRPSARTPAGDAVADTGLWLILAFSVVLTLGQVYAQRDPVDLPGVKPAGYVATVAVTGGFVLLRARLSARKVRRSGAIAAAMAALGLATTATTSGWMLLTEALAAVLLVTSGVGAALAAGAFLAVAYAAMAVLSPGDPPTVLLIILATVSVAGFALYALTRLVLVLGELRVAREHLARVSVDEERSRISRDLHDLLGRTLVAAGLRNETALLLLDADPQRCRTQLVELRSSLLDGQAKLRALTQGPTLVGLDDELRSARDLCARLGIRADVQAVPVPDPTLDRLLAAVVREAVTNALRHARPSTCRIAVDRAGEAVLLEIVNDGARPVPGAGDAEAGTGLATLAARVHALGGRLEAGRLEAGTRDRQEFRVAVRLPACAPLAAEVADA